MTMLDLSQINRIYLATGKTDLRKGIDGLVTVITEKKNYPITIKGNSYLGSFSYSIYYFIIIVAIHIDIITSVNFVET
ncbi:hypothetical protein GNF18_06305 [Ligilactobacillus pobuzihii]|uniref:hypothetical protein n=1 Tax=Ligilactobacillus pobuzihii TaxID=449659 RepID=UPI0019D2E884|nr:hypothetical protein [Ligilactobacillus pobuzihii]MBN7274746.1 hypothetical protein [Ligilactobacillus pobuzihii]